MTIFFGNKHVYKKLKNNTRKIFSASGFILKFVKKIGLSELPGKIVKTFSEEGFTGVFQKLKYIIKQALKGDITMLNFQGYESWFNSFCVITPEKRKTMSEKTASFQFSPLISVILPTYNSNPAWLKEAIFSVQNQIYPNWELCVADDASTDKKIIALLQEYSQKNLGIKSGLGKPTENISKF